MDLWDVLHHRHSIRHFDPEKQVTDEQIQKALEAAIHAPSAGNLQSWFFYVVRNETLRQQLTRATTQRFLSQASVIIVVCADVARCASVYGQRGASLYCLQDTAAATEHLLLAATALGLGSCWVGAFDEGAVARLLKLPQHLRPVALVPIGYPLRVPSERRPRRGLEEVSVFLG